ncbi:hypothetical protein DRQ53_08555 [bacterium]|nr:MAG: hypothetical protein DRQ32_05080 [bacterium]RKZ15628.1 MAG: hypothetical protein DRQ53_08555 [bacterium]
MNNILHPEQVRAFRRMTPRQKLALNASLWEHAHALKEAFFRARQPAWDDEQIRQAARETIQRAAR